jgi:cardiolipin synthase
MAACARSELLLATPYFLPGRKLSAALVAAVGRGVRVVVVVPRPNDLAWFKHAARRLYHSLLAHGVEIWERCDRMVHAKVAVVDREVAAVGSVNLNRQSMHANSETLLLTAAPQVVAEAQALAHDESLAAADRLHPLGWGRHPDRLRWAETLATAVDLVF